LYVNDQNSKSLKQSVMFPPSHPKVPFEPCGEGARGWGSAPDTCPLPREPYKRHISGLASSV